MKFKLLKEDFLTDNKIIAYHGSKKKFDKFDLSKVGSNIGTNQFDVSGIYMSPDKDFAIGYAIGETTGVYTKDNKQQEFTTPASDGYVYTCTLIPNKVLIASSQKEYDNYRKNPKLLDNCDLLIHKNIEYTDPSKNNEVVDTNGVEYVVLNPDIITIDKVEHFSVDGNILDEKIVKIGNKWQVQSEKGRNMGTYNTKAEAEKRLQQVHYFKYANEELSTENLDSEGNPLTKEQVEFFKNSKVRDLNDNLLVCYHGTDKKFTTFEKGDVGFHFGTKNQSEFIIKSKGFKTPQINAFYLNIKNPAYMYDFGPTGPYSIIYYWWSQSFENEYKIFEFDMTQEELDKINKVFKSSGGRTFGTRTDDDITDALDANECELGDYSNIYDSPEAKVLREILSARGYDGIIYENNFEDESGDFSYIAFYPNQIKSINNKEPSNSNNINEKLMMKDKMWIFDSPYSLIDFLRNQTDDMRILYDEKIDKYLVCDAKKYIHFDVIREARREGYYAGLEDFIYKLGGTIDNYIDFGRDGGFVDDIDIADEDDYIYPYIYYIYFSPDNSYEYGTDDYNESYETSIGTFWTRKCDIEEIKDFYNCIKNL